MKDLEYLHSDVVVAGAGLSGLCAAISAARLGLNVILAGDRPVLGGNSSSEVRMWTRGASGGGNLFSEEMGILGELKLRNLQINPNGNVVYWDEVLLEAVLTEPNITLFLNTYITNVRAEGGMIEYVEGLQLGSERHLRFFGKTYVDATGDGVVGARAGVPFLFGDDEKVLRGMETSGHKASFLGSSIYYFVKKARTPVPFIPPSYIHNMDYIAALIDKGGRIVDEKRDGQDYWWFEYGGERNTIKDSQEINIELKKIALGVWNYIKNSGKFDADYLTLEWLGSFAGKRESRRMVCESILNGNDGLNSKDFLDAAFYGGWYVDIHPPGGFYSEKEACVQTPVAVYPIPLGALYNLEFPNLTFAGRIIGADKTMFASIRIMNTCALSGQAAGTLAAFGAKDDKYIPELAKTEVGRIQQQLVKDDMFIPGLKNHDKADLAGHASVSASNWVKRWVPEPDSILELDRDTFVCFPTPAGVHRAEIILNTIRDTTLEIELYASLLPSRLVPGEFLSCAEYPIKKGCNLIIEWSGRNESTFVTVIIKANSDAMLVTCQSAPEGFLAGGVKPVAYVYPCVNIELGELYSPAALTNGFNRPYGAPNMWLAESPEAEVFLKWPEPVTIRQVRLYLNPDLSKEFPSSFPETWSEDHVLLKREKRPPQLAEDIQLIIKREGDWEKTWCIAENWQRLVLINLAEPVETTEIKLLFCSKPGQQYPQMFELRAY